MPMVHIYNTYRRNEVAWFRKTKEEFGGLSNMAGGYPVEVNGIIFHTIEALYQCCRFPNLPDVQKLIASEKSPVAAKMKRNPYIMKTRSDWPDVRIQVMEWCLMVKLAQNWEKFSSLLISTGNKIIVEDSPRDYFWGAKPQGKHKLVGNNALGQLLMILRQWVTIYHYEHLRDVRPPNIDNFYLFGHPVQSTITFNDSLLFDK